MKATLEFNLPEERLEHETAVHAQDYRSALDDLRMFMRNWRKHGRADGPEWNDACEAIWDEYHRIMEDLH